jgi:DNA-binding CsgD family transcriptional regulator
MAMSTTRTSSRTIRAGQHAIAQLTARQVTVLRLAASGLSGKQIARQLGISTRTVQGHFRDMRQRTGTRNHSELVAWSAAAGLLPPGGPPPARPGSHPGPPADQAPRRPP